MLAVGMHKQQTVFLFKCCTIDWFSERPRDALESVAVMFLQEMPDLETCDTVVDGLLRIFQQMTDRSGRVTAVPSRARSLQPSFLASFLASSA